MYNKSNKQLLITQATIEAYRQESDEKMKHLKEDLKSTTKSTIKSTMDHNRISKYPLDQKDSPKA